MVHEWRQASTKVHPVLVRGLGPPRRGTESGMANDIRPGTLEESPFPPGLILGQNSPLVLWA